MDRKSRWRLVLPIFLVVACASQEPVPDEVASAHSGVTALSVTQPTLLLDEAVYRANGCVAIRLTVPLAMTQGLHPVAELGSMTGQVPNPSRVTVPLIAGQADGAYQVYEPARCVHLHKTHAPAGALSVTPGSTLLVLARSPQGPLLALAMATIAGGEASGRFHAVVDSNQTPPQIPQQPPVPVGAMVDPQGHRAQFVEDHVIVRETKPGGLAAFVNRHNGHVLNTVTIPSQQGAPTIYHVVQVDLSTVDPSNLELLVERLGAQSGTWVYSSNDALRLIALTAQEAVAGNILFLDLVDELDAAPISNEGFTSPSWFSTPWYLGATPTGFGPGARVREAMTLAEILLKPTILTGPPPKVGVAILDGGFAEALDFAPALPPANLDYGMPFTSIPQRSVNAFGFPSFGYPAATGPNLSTCGGLPCPYHGNGVFSAAGATLNNGYGAAGVGWRAVSPVLVKRSGTSTMISLASAVVFGVEAGTAAAPTRVLNMSMHVDCEYDAGIFGRVNLCDAAFIEGVLTVGCIGAAYLAPETALVCTAIKDLLALTLTEPILEKAIEYAEVKGAIVVAAAGNSPDDVSDMRRVPCTISNVICVGALDNVTTVPFGARNAKSGHGNRVDVWAPHGIAVSPTPDKPAGDTVYGTSIAAPIVSGSIALAFAINPALSPADIRALLGTSNCRTAGTGRSVGSSCTLTGDAEVDTRGALDALELVRIARLTLPPSLAPSLGRCTGGVSTDDELVANDGPDTSMPVAPIVPEPGSETQYPLSGDGDLSIHALRVPLAPDEDWYQLTTTKPCPARAFLATVSVAVPDPKLGTLLLEVYEANADPTKLPTLIPATYCPPAACPNSIEATFTMATNVTYLAKVTARTDTNTNCYSRILLHLNNELPPPNGGSCPPP